MKRMMHLMTMVIVIGPLYAMEDAVEKKQYAFIPDGRFVHDSVEWVTMSPDDSVILSGSPFDKSILVKGEGYSMKCPFGSVPRSAVFSSDSQQAVVAVRNVEGAHPNYQDGFEILDSERDYWPASERYATDMMCHFLEFAPDNKNIIVANHKEVRFIACDTGALKHGMKYSNSITYEDDNAIVQCFIREKILYALLRSGIAKRTNINTYESLNDVTYPIETNKRIEMRPGRAGKDYVSAGDDRVAMLSTNAQVSVHNLSTGELVSDITQRINQGKPTYIMRLALSRSGKKIALESCETNGVLLCIIDVDNAQAKNIELPGGREGHDTLTFSPDSAVILAVSDGENIASILSAEDGSTLFKFASQYRPCTGQFSSDGSLALVACRRGDKGEVLIAKRVDNNNQEIQDDGDDEIELQEKDDDDDNEQQGNKPKECVIL